MEGKREEGMDRVTVLEKLHPQICIYIYIYMCTIYIFFFFSYVWDKVSGVQLHTGITCRVLLRL